MALDDQRRIVVAGDTDILAAREAGRALGAQLGFGAVDIVYIATAISEVARNILEHAGRGEVLLEAVARDGRPGLVVIARDDGPGIADLTRALQDGYSTGKGLGLGLPGARRMMDEFEVETAAGRGTTVTMRKFLGEG